MATHFNPRSEIHNSSGTPYNGALAYFYITGTDTLKSVYTNEGLTIAHANPVVADAAGHWASIYLNTDAAYKVVIKDSSGNTIYTDDPVRPVPLYTDFSTSVTHGYRTGNSPVRYGALGDGVADESAYVQSAITNASGTVDLLGLTYRCDSQLTVPSNRRIINGVLDFSSCTASDGFIKIAGTLESLQAASTVASMATSLTSTLTPTAVAGDLIRIQSADALGSGTGRAEFQRVRSVSGTTVNFQGVVGTLNFTTSPQYAVVTSKSRVVLSDLEIRGALTGTRYGIFVSYGESVRIERTTFKNINTSCVWLQNCVDVQVSAIRVLSSTQSVFIDGCDDVSVHGIEDDGYTTTAARIQIGKASTGVGQSTDIVSQNIRIRDCVMRNYSTAAGAGIAAYLYSRHVLIDGCTVRNSLIGIRVECLNDAVVTNCIVSTAASSTGDGIYGAAVIGSLVQSWKISNNVIDGGFARSIVVASTVNSASLVGVDISGNDIRNAAVSAIIADFLTGNTTNIQDVTISRNRIYHIGASGYGIRVRTSSSATASVASDIIISHNAIRYAADAGTGISVSRGHATPSLKGIVINGNNFTSTTGTAAAGIEVLSGEYASIAGNVLRGAATVGISYATTLAVSLAAANISGNVIDGTATAIDINAGHASATMQGLVVGVNTLSSVSSRAVYVRTTSGGKIYESTVCGNAITMDATTSPCITIAGGGAGDVDTISVTGNATHLGSHNASFANDTNSNHAANAARGAGTATSTGATAVDGTNTPP